MRRALEASGSWQILVSPDHATLLRTRAHDRAPVPWAMAGTGLSGTGHPHDEIAAREAGGPSLDEGGRLMEACLAIGRS